MDESSNQDGAGAALVALVIVILLFLSIAAYFWLSRRTLVQRVQKAAAAEAATEAALARYAAEAEPAEPRSAENVEAEIRSVLQQQLAAWNDGDVEEFMQHYWKSDDLTFSSAGKLTRGWQATLEGYKRRYPSREEMGATTFDNLEITSLGPNAALALGDWRLSRELETIGGKFSLVFRYLDGRWVIVHDHTSRSEQPQTRPQLEE